jgi:hypothetical protein
MTKRSFPALLLLAGVFTAGCQEVQTPTDVTLTPQYGKPAPVVHPNARWVWHTTMSDNTASRIFGDGRLESGASAGGADSRYEGGKCGVLAQIRPGADGYGGDAPFDPDHATAPADCGGKREIIFNLSAPELGGNAATRSVADTWVHRLNRMDVGDTVYRTLTINNVPHARCTSIQYGVPNSSAALLDDRILSTDSTNTAVIAHRVSATEWTLESINNGQAQCSYMVKNRKHEGATVNLPFRVTITQVTP